MTSKIHNTFSVLMASSALVLGLFVASPATLPVANVVAAQSSAAFAAPVKADLARVADAAVIATLTAEAPVVADLATTLQDTAAAPAAVKQLRHQSGKSSRIRQSMAMPFFSFAPRG